MFPHYFDTDISAALPWTLMGFLAGALLVGFSRWLSGGGKQGQSIIEGLHDQLTASRIEYSRLAGDNGHLQTALADAERRASTGAQNAEALARLTKSEASAREELAKATSELARVRQDLASYNSRGSALEGEVQRLRAESASLKSSWEANAAQFSRLKAELSEAQMKLRDFDLIRLKLNAAEGQLTASSNAPAELEAIKAEYAKLYAAYEELARRPAVDPAPLAALQHDNARLNSEIAALNASIGEHKKAYAQVTDSSALVAAEQENAKLRAALNEARVMLRDTDLLKQQLQNAHARLAAVPSGAPTAAHPAAYSDALEAAEREIARLKTTVAYTALTTNGSAADELREELNQTKAALAAAQAASAARPAASGAMPAEYHGLMMDLTATRKLSIAQATELKNLRAEVERLSELERAAAESTGGATRFADKINMINRPVPMVPYRIRSRRDRDG